MADEKGNDEMKVLYEAVQGCGLYMFKQHMIKWSITYLEKQRVPQMADGWRRCVSALRGMIEKGHSIDEKMLDTAETMVTAWEQDSTMPLTADEWEMLSPRLGLD